MPSQVGRTRLDWRVHVWWVWTYGRWDTEGRDTKRQRNSWTYPTSLRVSSLYCLALSRMMLGDLVIQCSEAYVSALVGAYARIQNPAPITECNPPACQQVVHANQTKSASNPLTWQNRQSIWLLQGIKRLHVGLLKCPSGSMSMHARANEATGVASNVSSCIGGVVSLLRVSAWCLTFCRETDSTRWNETWYDNFVDVDEGRWTPRALE